jgi:hypothetical protein
MQYVNSNIAREVGDLVGWSGPFWARRYTAIVTSNEEAAQVERFRYILSHGVKENLVERVLDWPGVHMFLPPFPGFAWRKALILVDRAGTILIGAKHLFPGG